MIACQMLSYFASVAHILGLLSSLKIFSSFGAGVDRLGYPKSMYIRMRICHQMTVLNPLATLLPWPFKVGNIKLHTDTEVINENLLWHRHMCLR